MWRILARTLTSWGYLDCQRDSSSVNSDGQRESLAPHCVDNNLTSAVSKLLIRHLRLYYQYISQRDYGKVDCIVYVRRRIQYMDASHSRHLEGWKIIWRNKLTAAPIPKILEEFTPIKHVINDPVPSDVWAQGRPGRSRIHAIHRTGLGVSASIYTSATGVLAKYSGIRLQRSFGCVWLG